MSYKKKIVLDDLRQELEKWYLILRGMTTPPATTTTTTTTTTPTTPKITDPGSVVTLVNAFSKKCGLLLGNYCKAK